MVINRSKHNKYTTGAIYGNQTSGGITTDADGNVTASDGLGYSGGIIYINGGAGGGISQELIDMLTNQDAFSYFNVSDGINTVNVEAKQEKDYINLNIIGDNESVETKVSTEKYLPETYYNSTGLKPGRYSVSYNKILIPDISGGDPVEIVKWVITIKKIYGDPIFPSTDFNGVQLLEDGNSLGAFSIDSDRLTVTSNQTTGLQQIVIQLDSLINFTEIRLISSEDYTSSAYTTITDIKDITIQTFTTVLISQAGATRYWKLDENGKLFTEYDVYTTKTLGAKDLIWSDKGYRVGNFVQGISGGIFHINDEIGTVYAELDKLRVRKKAYFETLEIVNVNTVGGKQIISPAGAITIRKVDINDTYYRCYFLGEQDGVEIENRFKVNDLAFSQNFNIKKPGNYEQVANHYFWRKVVGVSTQVDSDGNHYIDLSITDCDTDSDIPHVNDVVAQLGNTTDPDRQSAMIFSSVDSESPRIMLCHGIDTYTLNATNYFDLGVNHATNQAYMNVYGNTFIGAKDGSTYIDYSQTNGLTIKAHISASSTYGGQQFSDVFVTSENLSSSVKAIVGDDLEFLQNQIDGSIESYFYDYSPTLNNYPAVEWTTEADKQRHNGDTFTNIQEFISDSLTPDAGKSWRWVKNDSGVWGWIPISDSDAVAALKKAGQAQDTADGKRKVFTQKPGLNDDYQVGDLWVNATFTDANGLLLYSNDLLRANTAKNKGELFSISHWELASKYTDDTMASDALAKANAAQAAANAAGSAATQAQTEINAYKIEIDDIFSDGVITTSERNRLNTLKDTINTTLFDVQTTYNNVYNNSALDGKTQKTALQTAYTQFSNSATALLNSVTTVTNKSTISKGDISAVDQAYSNFNTKYTDYVAALHAANLEIMNTLSNTAYANAVNKFAWLNGLFDPDQTTTIDGGVVTTGVLALGKTTSGVFNVNAGINGVSNSSYLGNGIALWFGGDMIDKDNYTAGNRPANVATSLIRFDGSGYLGYVPNSDSSKDEAAIWWDATGNIHANPLSFFVGPESVGLLMSAFQVVPSTSNRATYVIQRAPFQEVRIGNAYLGYDVVNNAVYVYTRDEQGNEIACNFYARGGVSALGFTSGSGGAGGLDVDAMWDILGEAGTEQIHPSHISTALSTYATQDWVTEQLGSITVDTTNLVTINTVQTITSAKTFTKPVKVSITAITPSQEGLHYYNGNTLLGAIGAVHDGTAVQYMQLNPKGVLDGFNGLVVGDELGFNGYQVFHSGNTIIPRVPDLRKYVTLNTAQTITGGKTFMASTLFRSDTRGIIVYNDIRNKAGAIEILGANGTWSQNCLEFENNGNLTALHSITASSFIKSGGTASQFLKADGSVDSNTYLTESNLDNVLKQRGHILTQMNTYDVSVSKYAAIEQWSTSTVGRPESYGTALTFRDKASWYYRLAFGTSGTIYYYNGINTTTLTKKGTLAFVENLYSKTESDGRYVKKAGDTMAGVLTTTTGINSGIKVGNTHITAIEGNLIFYKNANIRFGGDAWDYSQWGGLKYSHSNKYVYLGIADGTIFAANQAQSNGSILTPGITNIYVGNNVTNKVWHAGNDGSGSGLDADLLDGLHATVYGNGVLKYVSLPAYYDFGSSTSSYDYFLNLLKWSYSNGSFNYAHSTIIGNGHPNAQGTTIISLYGDSGVNSAGVPRYSSGLYIGYGSNFSFFGTSDYNYYIRDIAFTDSNVSSATKLATARTIWGQSFDGTGNVSGDMTNVGNITTTALNGRKIVVNGPSSNVWLHVGTGGANHGIYSGSKDAWICATDGTNTFMSIGNVGIGTTAPSYKLHVAGSVYSSGWYYSQGNGYFINTGNVYYSQKDGYPDIYTGNGNEICIGSKTTDIYVNYRKSNAPNTPVNWHWMNGTSSGYANFTLGNLHAITGIWSNGYVSAKGQNTSDIRLKTDINNFNATIIIKSLRPVSFKWNDLARKNSKVFDTDEVQYGLIAQEVKAVAPWAAVDNMFKDGYMGVRYDKFIPVLMKAQIETIDEVTDLKRRVTELEKENKRLKELYHGK